MNIHTPQHIHIYLGYTNIKIIRAIYLDSRGQLIILGVHLFVLLTVTLPWNIFFFKFLFSFSLSKENSSIKIIFQMV